MRISFERFSIFLTKTFLKLSPFSIVFTRSGNFLVLHFRDLIIIDYDCDRDIAVQELSDLASKNPDQLWYLYQTHEGVHACLVSHRVTPAQFSQESKQLFKALSSDSRWFSGAMKWGCYRTRITPKKGRNEKFIKRFIGTIGEGKPDTQQKCLLAMHDRLISLSEKIYSLHEKD